MNILRKTSGRPQECLCRSVPNVQYELSQKLVVLYGRTSHPSRVQDGKRSGKMEDENAAPNIGKKHDSDTAADLERVTDYAEEKEIKLDVENVSMTID